MIWEAESNIAGLELTIRPLPDFLAWAYPAFDEVACEFIDPELCAPKV